MIKIKNNKPKEEFLDMIKQICKLRKFTRNEEAIKKMINYKKTEIGCDVDLTQLVLCAIEEFFMDIYEVVEDEVLLGCIGSLCLEYQEYFMGETDHSAVNNLVEKIWFKKGEEN